MDSLKELIFEYRRVVEQKDAFHVDVLVDIAIDLFKMIRVDNMDYKDGFNDVLLLQYGVYNWGDENGNHFSFDVTRQVTVPEEDEPYQISLILIYEPSVFSEIKPYNIWSNAFNSVDDFVNHIKSTSGYKLASKTKAKHMQLLFGQC